MNPTRFKLTALEVLREGPIREQDFARVLWPESKVNVLASIGRAYLGKLEREGLAKRKYTFWLKKPRGWILTHAGRKLLAESDA